MDRGRNPPLTGHDGYTRWTVVAVWAAAGIAQRAKVGYLLFTHIIPPLPVEALEGPFLGKSRQIYSGLIRVGHDGDFISLPAGGAEIHRSNRLAIFR